MTTIAYKSGIIAYDSQVTQGDVIKDLNFSKKFERDGIVFFMVGSPCDFETLISSWFTGKNVLLDGLIPDASAFVVDKDKLWECGVNESGVFCSDHLPLDRPDACGSGASFALAAMDCGLSAEDAVKVAANRDLYTGGVIRVFEIPVVKTVFNPETGTLSGMVDR